MKGLVTSRLTSLSSGVIRISWILSAKTGVLHCVLCVSCQGEVKIRDSSFTRLYEGELMAETIDLIGHPTLLVFGKPVHLGSIEYLGVSRS